MAFFIGKDKMAKKKTLPSEVVTSEAYVVPLRDNKNIKYANKDDLMTAAHEKYRKDPKDDENEIPSNSYPYEQKELERHFSESDKSVRRPQDVKIHKNETTENNS